MRYSQLFGKTTRDAPKDEVSLNAKLLMRAGFIHKEMAGVYAFLPLGWRVFEKIKDIIREEMDSLGAQEIVMTSLQPKENWEKTNRWDEKVVDVWFKTKLKNDVELGLAWSHEEPITLMLRNHVHSYRDLPVNVYQFQNKLRNETRAKSGIMRTREFVMKDLYSYSRDEKEHGKFYDSVSEAYMRIFAKVGLRDLTYFTFASGGAFTQFSHEFQTICTAGEDTIYINKKRNIAVNKEVYTDEVLRQLKLKKSDMVEEKAAEVGNIFNFGPTKAMELDLYFTDKDGERKPAILGSYGIGVGRLMGVLVEIFADENGIVWPEEVAPYRVHLINIKNQKSKIKNRGDGIYEQLERAGMEVLYDDREDVSSGEKFSDADLIGIPWRVVVSEKTGGKVEVKRRDGKKTELMALAKFIDKLGN